MLHHFGYFLHCSYIKISVFYTISTPLKNLPPKCLHRFYTIISDFYTVPTPKSSESTPFLHRFKIMDYIILFSLKMHTKIQDSYPPCTSSHIYHFSQHNLICRISCVIHHPKLYWLQFFFQFIHSFESKPRIQSNFLWRQFPCLYHP